MDTWKKGVLSAGKPVSIKFLVLGGGGILSRRFSCVAESGCVSTHPLESQRPATGLRTPKSPKVPGRVPGRVPGKKGTAGGTAGSSAVSLLFQRKGPPSTAPSSPPSSPLFPGTLPGTLPGTFGDLGVLSPVAGRWDSNSKSPP